jgi:hypothetical protein
MTNGAFGVHDVVGACINRLADHGGRGAIDENVRVIVIKRGHDAAVLMRVVMA